MIFNIKSKFYRMREKLTTKIVWSLPRYLVMWCYMRVVVHATSGNFGNTVVPELSVMSAVKRWDSS